MVAKNRLHEKLAKPRNKSLQTQNKSNMLKRLKTLMVDDLKFKLESNLNEQKLKQPSNFLSLPQNTVKNRMRAFETFSAFKCVKYSCIVCTQCETCKTI